MPVGEQLSDNAGALLGGLAGAVDRFGKPLAQSAVVVDAGVAEVREGEVTNHANGVVGCHSTRGDVVE